MNPALQTKEDYLKDKNLSLSMDSTRAIKDNDSTFWERKHRELYCDARDNGRPFLASQAESYGIFIPKWYKKENDLYVFER